MEQNNLFYNRRYLIMLSDNAIKLATDLINNGYKLKVFDNKNRITLVKGKTTININPRKQKE